MLAANWYGLSPMATLVYGTQCMCCDYCLFTLGKCHVIVFQTRDPSKDLLRIVSQSDGRYILEEMLNLPCLEEAIRKRVELP